MSASSRPGARARPGVVTAAETAVSAETIEEQLRGRRGGEPPGGVRAAPPVVGG